MSQYSPQSLDDSISAGDRKPARLPHHPLQGNSVHAHAHGKAILVGEHAVIYGARAIAFPVTSVGMNIQLTPTKSSHRTGEHGIQIRALLGGRSVSDHLKNIIYEAFEILNIKPFSLEIEGFSTGLIGAGMGSSATLCVVILKALAQAVGRQLSASEIAFYANRLERHFHGNPSGLDTAVVAFESPLCFQIQMPPTLIQAAKLVEAEDPSWPFALLDSTTRSSTIAMVKGVSPYFLDRHHGTQRVERFDHLACVAKAGLQEGDTHAVAYSMDESGRLLSEAGASSPVLDELMALCHKLGCLAAKPTGAGGGGCVLTLLDPGKKAYQLNQLRQQLGSQRVIVVNGPQPLTKPEYHG